MIYRERSACIPTKITTLDDKVQHGVMFTINGRCGIGVNTELLWRLCLREHFELNVIVSNGD